MTGQDYGNLRPLFHQVWLAAIQSPVHSPQVVHAGGQHGQIMAYHAAGAAPAHVLPIMHVAGQLQGWQNHPHRRWPVMILPIHRLFA